ncbi:Glycoside hydrolase, family 28 [Dillenia turbinata]|uniref:Glycoside hydrolase, family 28 n=1 Tax=Dillenia turbinata TaxID=194707 RepID=A0AAN8ZAK9_9MAGN
MASFTTKSLISITIIAMVVIPTSFKICSLAESKHYRQTREGSAAPMTTRKLLQYSTIFNILDYGAKGDGTTDDTQAFQAAWAATCPVPSSTMVVPSGFVFLVGPVTFSGPKCGSNIVFQLDGKIIAPTSPGPWGKGTLQWIQFKKLSGITITGKGTIDGQGSVWWKNAAGLPSTRPTALRFYGSFRVTVSGITIQNSPWTHLKFDSCNGVQVYSMSTSSPGSSPNTDGIHLQNSLNVEIYSSNLACGDDCVSIQTGCSGISIHDVSCGPGHGISIGGLGQGNTKACVSNITVTDVTMLNTQTAVRIKTWQGGSGSVRGVTFSNIKVSAVKNPIVIDQYYCNVGKCKNQTSGVAVSGISYDNIKGTYTGQPVYFACSDSTPCTDITVSGIVLTPVQTTRAPFCWKTYGQVTTTTVPAINCLLAGNSSATGSQSC